MIFISLIISTLACFFLIGRVPIFWVMLVFVYLPAVGILVRQLLAKQFSSYLSLDKRSGFYSLTLDAPKFFRWYSIAVDVFVGSLIGFSIAYFFMGGWTNGLPK